MSKTTERQRQETPIACNWHAIAPEDRDHHTAVGTRMFAAVEEVQLLDDGYGFRLPPERALLRDAADFIANERLCCPFFRFTVELEPDGGALWLRLTGREGVRELLAAEVHPLIKRSVLEAAGLG